MAALWLAAVPGIASAAFVEPPQLPHVPTVFPDRDFVSAEGYDKDKDMRITVLRNGVKIGEAFGTTDDAGLLEVNHPGGVCWSGTTPNIIAGDKVVIADAADPVDVGDAVTVSNVTAEPAIKERDALGDLTGRVIVRGRALNADGTAMDLGSVEQRVVNPELKETSVGKRDVRAVLGEGLSADPSQGVGGFVAVYDQFPDDIDTLIVNGQTRVLTWQGVTPGGDRLGITIHEVGEIGGPGFGGCPGGSDYAVTGANHPAVTKAMEDTGASLVVSGVALDASAVSVTLSDGVDTTTPVAATLDVASGPQTWTAEFTPEQLYALADGALTASATYTVADSPIGGVSRKFTKDTVAPGAPTATPGGGTYEGPQAVTLQGTDPTAKIRFAVGEATPTAASPVAPAQLSITSSQTVRALAVDRVGNESPVSTFAYVITGRRAAETGATVVQAIPGAGAATNSTGVATNGTGAATDAAVLGSQASSALRVSNLSLSRRVSVTRLRLRGLRLSMTVPQGATTLQITVYKARNGRRTGRALFRATRTTRAGLYRVTLRDRTLLRRLRAGSYVAEVRVGRSAASLGTVRRISFTVIQSTTTHRST